MKNSVLLELLISIYCRLMLHWIFKQPFVQLSPWTTTEDKNMDKTVTNLILSILLSSICISLGVHFEINNHNVRNMCCRLTFKVLFVQYCFCCIIIILSYKYAHILHLDVQ